MISGIRGISRLELKGKTEDSLNPVREAKSRAKNSTNGRFSESFKYRLGKICVQDRNKNTSSTQNGSGCSNTFPWGRRGFSATKTSENRSSASPYAAQNKKVN